MPDRANKIREEIGLLKYGCPVTDCDELFSSEAEMLKHLEETHGITDYIYVHGGWFA